MRTRVLVVANQTATSEELIEALSHRGEVHAMLLIPGSGPGLGGREAARPRLEEALAVWHEAGIEAEGEVGDPNPYEAVAEIWNPGRFDEVIVSTLPGESSKWIRSDLPHRVARLTDCPVTHVVAFSMRHPERHPEPAPVKEKPALGPLSVLSWGGPREGERR